MASPRQIQSSIRRSSQRLSDQKYCRSSRPCVRCYPRSGHLTIEDDVSWQNLMRFLQTIFISVNLWYLTIAKFCEQSEYVKTTDKVSIHIVILETTLIYNTVHNISNLSRMRFFFQLLAKQTKKTSYPSMSGTSLSNCLTAASLASGVEGGPSLDIGKPIAIQSTNTSMKIDKRHQCWRRKRTPEKKNRYIWGNFLDIVTNIYVHHRE